MAGGTDARDPAWLSRRRGKVAAVCGLLALLGIGPFVADETSRSEAVTELVVNSGFNAGTTGWRTNDPAVLLSVATDAAGNNFARLESATTRGLVLNDVVNTVRSAPPQRTYRMSARIRTNKSLATPVAGAIRVREVSSGGAVVDHRQAFTTASRKWETGSLTFTTSSTAALDVNVLGFDVPAGGRLVIDDVSLTTDGGAGSCRNPIPDGTRFGASLTLVGVTAAESLAQLDTAFGRVRVVRVFNTGFPASWSEPRMALTSDRTVVVSFRPHPRDVNAGLHDDVFRSWFESAPSEQVVYWSYIHEPESEIEEGQFSAAEYRAAWRRLAGLADQACKPNLFATLIVTGWTADARSGRDYRVYDAGADVIDVIGWDLYNGASDPDRDYYEPVADVFGRVVDPMHADGRPWDVPETGHRLVPGDAGSGRAAWLRDFGEYSKANGARFVSYYQSNTPGSTVFRLDDQPSRDAWRSLVVNS